MLATHICSNFIANYYLKPVQKEKKNSNVHYYNSNTHFHISMFVSETKGVLKFCEYALGNFLALCETHSDNLSVNTFKTL